MLRGNACQMDGKSHANNKCRGKMHVKWKVNDMQITMSREKACRMPCNLPRHFSFAFLYCFSSEKNPARFSEQQVTDPFQDPRINPERNPQRDDKNRWALDYKHPQGWILNF